MNDIPDIKITFNYYIIDDYIKSNGLTKRKFCKLCGISPATLDGFKNGKRSKLKSLVKIADLMDLPLNDYFTITREK